ncbi:MAG TPA: hypothetical protein VF399_04140 [bacterium]
MVVGMESSRNAQAVIKLKSMIRFVWQPYDVVYTSEMVIGPFSHVPTLDIFLCHITGMLPV